MLLALHDIWSLSQLFNSAQTVLRKCYIECGHRQYINDGCGPMPIKPYFGYLNLNLIPFSHVANYFFSKNYKTILSL